MSVDAQTITAEAVKRKQLEQAFQDILVIPSLFGQLGPAINSGAGLFLCGARATAKPRWRNGSPFVSAKFCIPKALIVESEIIEFFDQAYHTPVAASKHKLLRNDSHDQRWALVRRPTVIVGGELTLDSLAIRHNIHTHISEGRCK